MLVWMAVEWMTAKTRYYVVSLKGQSINGY